MGRPGFVYQYYAPDVPGPMAHPMGLPPRYLNPAHPMKFGITHSFNQNLSSMKQSPTTNMLRSREVLRHPMGAGLVKQEQ